MQRLLHDGERIKPSDAKAVYVCRGLCELTNLRSAVRTGSAVEVVWWSNGRTEMRTVGYKDVVVEDGKE